MAESRRDEIAKLEALYSENPDGRVFTHLAEAYRRAGEPERAREILEQGLGRHPEYASAHVVLGRVLVDLGRAEEAERAFRRVLELDPQNLVATRALADLARDAGKIEEALGYYRKLQEVDARNPELDEIVRSLEGQASGVAWDAAAPYDSEGPGHGGDAVPADGAPGGWSADPVEAVGAGSDPWGPADDFVGGWEAEPIDFEGDAAATGLDGVEAEYPGSEYWPGPGPDEVVGAESEPAMGADGAGWEEAAEAGDEEYPRPVGFAPGAFAGSTSQDDADDLLDVTIGSGASIESMDAVASWDVTGIDMDEVEPGATAAESGGAIDFDLAVVESGDEPSAGAAEGELDVAESGPEPGGYEAAEPEASGAGWAGDESGGAGWAEAEALEAGSGASMAGDDAGEEGAAVEEPTADHEAATPAGTTWEAEDGWDVDDVVTAADWDEGAYDDWTQEEPTGGDFEDVGAEETWAVAEPWTGGESAGDEPWAAASADGATEGASEFEASTTDFGEPVQDAGEPAWEPEAPVTEMIGEASEYGEPTPEAEAPSQGFESAGFEAAGGAAGIAAEAWGVGEAAPDLEEPVAAHGEPAPEFGDEVAEQVGDEAESGEPVSEIAEPWAEFEESSVEAAAPDAEAEPVADELEAELEAGETEEVVEPADAGIAAVEGFAAEGVEEADVDPFAGPGGYDEEDAFGGEVVTETLAELYLAQGLNERAVEVYEELLRRRPGDPVLEERLREALAGTGQVRAMGPEADDRAGGAAEAMEDESELESVESFWTGGSGAVVGDAAGEDALYGLDEPVEAAAEPDEAPVSAYLQSLLAWRPARAVVEGFGVPVGEPAGMDDVDALFAPRAEGPGSGMGGGPAPAADAAGAPQDGSGSGSDPDDDDDLEMFRAWLQSLKR